MQKDRRCKNCKETYEAHVYFILDEWDTHGYPDNANLVVDEHTCTRFNPMNNLELLEWEEERRRTSLPTRRDLQ